MKATKIALLVATLSSIRIIGKADWAAPSMLDCLVTLTAAVMWAVWGYYKFGKRPGHGE